jgi:hypothetical protein
MLRRLLGLMIILVVTIGVPACGDGGSKPKTAPPKDPEGDAKPNVPKAKAG